jgi:inward rectifier potassium channel
VATIGYGDVYPVSTYANCVVVAEITLGILLFALTTGIAFARFSRPTARILFSDVAVVTPVDGVPTLMFRTANQRHNLIFGAAASVSVLMDEMVGGREMRRFRDLELVRSMNPVFALTWTVMHPITDASPLKALLDGGKIDDMEIVAILSASTGAPARRFMRAGLWAGDIRWDACFVDILGQAPDGVRTIDYRHFHEVEVELRRMREFRSLIPESESVVLPLDDGGNACERGGEIGNGPSRCQPAKGLSPNPACQHERNCWGPCRSSQRIARLR